MHTQRPAAAGQAPVIHRNLRNQVLDPGRSTPKPQLDPLHTPAMERFMLETSGILKVRPPIPAAPSGDSFLRVIPFQILSWAPRLVVFPAFIDKARADAIIRMSNSSLWKSSLAFRPGEKIDANQEVRTSSGTYLAASNNPEDPLAWLEERIAAATLIPSSHGEAFNVLKYENTQHYDSHMDAFDPKEYGPQASQRVATVLVILAAPEEGGETIFKRQGFAHEKKLITDWKTCSEGYKYIPRQGDAIMFWNVKANGEIDGHSLHGGCPVLKGEKWVATKWLRNVGFGVDRSKELEQAVRKNGGNSAIDVQA